MTSKSEAMVDGLAALLVLFTAMLDPQLSMALAVVFLLGLAVSKLRRQGGARE